ncbi:hypothetical protein STSP_38020 [Streptomyces jeddahensis]|uniref:Transposase DDE domain-containing protein n=1 Tax=Streptomyces jeddahensis TaxID=1716141 RepID=A0A177HPC3_9ACTN|nr:hypothetical protein STSP_38020 [Streptomyces jeddahensis]
MGIDIEVVQRGPNTKGFMPTPKRWIVEQTFGTLLLHRCVARGYETRPASAASRIRWGRRLERLEITRATILQIAQDSDPGGSEPLPSAYRQILALLEDDKRSTGQGHLRSPGHRLRRTGDGWRNHIRGTPWGRDEVTPMNRGAAVPGTGTVWKLSKSSRIL